jgi:hypothetical protein
MTHERKVLRDLGQLPHERVKTIDEDDNVVIRGDDGKWVQTGEKISQRSPDILQDSLKISDLEQQDRMNDASAGIIADPHSMVGGSVYRRFKKPRYKKKIHVCAVCDTHDTSLEPGRIELSENNVASRPEFFLTFLIISKICRLV